MPVWRYGRLGENFPHSELCLIDFSLIVPIKAAFRPAVLVQTESYYELCLFIHTHRFCRVNYGVPCCKILLNNFSSVCS